MKIAIIDTEFTSWEGSMQRGWSDENEHREIIQIAAVKFDIDKNEILKEEILNVIVKPLKNPVLSGYIKDLTGLSQKQINEEGLTYGEAVEKLSIFEEDTIGLYAWGQEEFIFYENNNIHGLPKYPKKCFDLHNFFFRKNLIDSNINSGKFGIYCNQKVDSDYSEHNALYDVFSIAVGLKYMIKENKIDITELVSKNMN